MQSGEIAFQIDQQYRSILIMWFVFVISLSAFFLLCYLVTPAAPSRIVSDFGFVLVAFGLVLVVDSFLLKRQFLARAAKKHDPSLVNRAYILAFATCEAAGCFGVLLWFGGAFRYYYVSFALAGMGMLFHFPRKDHAVGAYELG